MRDKIDVKWRRQFYIRLSPKKNYCKIKLIFRFHKRMYVMLCWYIDVDVRDATQLSYNWFLFVFFGFFFFSFSEYNIGVLLKIHYIKYKIIMNLYCSVQLQSYSYTIVCFWQHIESAWCLCCLQNIDFFSHIQKFENYFMLNDLI